MCGVDQIFGILLAAVSFSAGVVSFALAIWALMGARKAEVKIKALADANDLLRHKLAARSPGAHPRPIQ